MEHVKYEDFDETILIKPELTLIKNKNNTEEDIKKKLLIELKKFYTEHNNNLKQEIILNGKNLKNEYISKINKELEEYYKDMKKNNDNKIKDYSISTNKVIQTEIKELSKEKIILNNEIKELQKNYTELNHKYKNLDNFVNDEFEKITNTPEFNSKIEEDYKIKEDKLIIEYKRKEDDLRVIYDEQLVIYTNKFNKDFSEIIEELKELNEQKSKLRDEHQSYIYDNNICQLKIDQNNEEINNFDEKMEKLNNLYYSTTDEKNNILNEIKKLNLQLTETKNIIYVNENTIKTQDTQIIKNKKEIKHVEDKLKNILSDIGINKNELIIIKQGIKHENNNLNLSQTKNEKNKNEIFKQKKIIFDNIEYISNIEKQIDDTNNAYEEMTNNKNRFIEEVDLIKKDIEIKKDELYYVNNIYKSLIQEYNLKRDESENIKVVKVLTNKEKKTINNLNEDDIVFKPIIESDLYELKKTKKNIDMYDNITISEKKTSINTNDNSTAIEFLDDFNKTNNNEILNKYIKIANDNGKTLYMTNHTEKILRTYFKIGNFKKISDQFLGFNSVNKTFEKNYIYNYLNEIYKIIK